MSISKVLGLSIAGVVMVGASVASAEEPPSREPPGYHQHDGFYLRLGLGGGYLSTSTRVSGSELSVTGGGPVLDVAVGGPCGGTSFSLVTCTGAAPKTRPSLEAEADSTANGVSNVLTSFGVGMAHYFGSNAFLGGSVLLSRLSINDDGGDTVARSKYGPGFSLIVGKEWWVSDNWGLGAAIHVF